MARFITAAKRDVGAWSIDAAIRSRTFIATPVSETDYFCSAIVTVTVTNLNSRASSDLYLVLVSILT